MTDETPEAAAAGTGRAAQRVLVLGANGPTGRLLVQQALDRGLHIDALTRHPSTFPIQHDRLRVIAGDATDPATIEQAVAGSDAVISCIGTAYTRKPVEVYSTTARLLTAAMTRHGLHRLIVVSSTSVATDSSHQGRFFFDQVVHPLLRHVIGRTLYDDMARMEATVTATSLDWTIIRPPGLSNQPGTGYSAAPTRTNGMFCARADLAAFLLDQLEDHRFLRQIAAVSTPGLQVNVLDMIRHEVLKR